MESGGKLCFLCVKLQDPSLNGAEKAEIRSTYIQCSECGICGTTVTDPCGTCRRAESYENGVSDNERDQAAHCRHATLELKLHKDKVDKVDSSAPVGTAVSLEELQTIRATQALWSRILKEVNGRWIEFYSAPLLEEETSLRAPNNYVFPADNLVMTVAQWYQTYSRPEYRDTYIVLPKQTQRKGKSNSKAYAFSVELYINVGQYTARTDDPELVGTGRAGTKRKTSATRIADTHAPYQSPKRSREGLSPQPSRRTLRSLFVGDGDLLTQTPSAISVVEIKFRKTTCLISDVSGSPTLMEEAPLLSGFLETRPLDLTAGERGTTKDVFGLRIGNKPYVAKKVINIGGGRSEDILLPKAVSVLTADLIRLKRMAYFADQFKELARDQGVDIAAFLIKVYTPCSAPPTRYAPEGDVDGADCDHPEPTEEMSGVYLVEPVRLTMTVVKFSGTLGSTTRTDLRSLTVTAYAHFVAEQTACRYIFADIQGSNNAKTGKLSLTLFDPMTHTIDGTSGIGDHGPKGLKDFVSSHTCNHVCFALQLASSEVLQNTLDDLLAGVGATDRSEETSESSE
uniref:Lmo1883 protein n=1 Tax=Ganoderma boninense TaxID=34458 RepID=A0A5K1K6Q3_9APHY|nr:Lmo1883 protein [Ganoderma boninense]